MASSGPSSIALEKATDWPLNRVDFGLDVFTGSSTAAQRKRVDVKTQRKGVSRIKEISSH